MFELSKGQNLVRPLATQSELGAAFDLRKTHFRHGLKNDRDAFDDSHDHIGIFEHHSKAMLGYFRLARFDESKGVTTG